MMPSEAPSGRMYISGQYSEPSVRSPCMRSESCAAMWHPVSTASGVPQGEPAADAWLAFLNGNLSASEADHLLIEELDQLGWFTFAKHLGPTAPGVHVLTDPPHFAVAHLEYEAVIVDVGPAIWKRGR